MIATASTNGSAKFNPHTHLTLGIISRYVSGRMIAPIQLSGIEANQMKEDLKDPDFIEAVATLGYEAEIEGETGGVTRITCKPIQRKPI